jgi:hypothetical protein
MSVTMLCCLVQTTTFATFACRRKQAEAFLISIYQRIDQFGCRFWPIFFLLLVGPGTIVIHNKKATEIYLPTTTTTTT